MFDHTLEALERELRVVVPDPQRAILKRQLPQPSREQLLNYLTNGQTYFYRHPDQFEALEAYLRQGDPIATQRIWSAGCSTGCEAYSIAILLEKTRRAGRVLGTDISAERLQEAEAGLYRESRMLRLSQEDKKKYFLPTDDGRHKVKSFLTATVSFALENLVDNDGPGMSRLWDVIFCRNVLIYFDEAGARDILQRLVARLEMGGLLVLGYPEAFFGLQHPELTLLAARTAIFRKASPVVRQAPATPLSTLPVAVRPGAFQEGLRLHAMGKLEEALGYFVEAEEKEPEFSLVQYFLARLFDELRQPERAVNCLKKFFDNYREDDPDVVAFISRNGVSREQLNLAATRLRERLERGLA